MSQQVGVSWFDGFDSDEEDEEDEEDAEDVSLLNDYPEVSNWQTMVLVKDNPRHKSNCDLLANTCFAHVLASGIQNSSSQCACVQLPLDPYLYGTLTLSAQKGPFGPSTEIRMPDLNPIGTDWSDWVGLMVSTHFGLVLGIAWSSGAQATRIQRYQHSSGFTGCKYFIIL